MNAQTKMQIARQLTNQVLATLQETDLAVALKSLNHHYNTTKVKRTTEELVVLVKQERNRIIWGKFATA